MLFTVKKLISRNRESVLGVAGAGITHTTAMRSDVRMAETQRPQGMVLARRTAVRKNSKRT